MMQPFSVESRLAIIYVLASQAVRGAMSARRQDGLEIQFAEELAVYPQRLIENRFPIEVTSPPCRLGVVHTKTSL